MNSGLIGFWLGGFVACIAVLVIEGETFRWELPRHLLRAYPLRVGLSVLISMLFWPAFLAALYAKVREDDQEEEP